MNMSRSQLPILPIAYRAVDGVDVRVATSDGDHDETLVLTCPWPESLYAFESTWAVLDERLPHSTLHQFDASHFLWEDARDEFSSLVAAWVRGSYADV
jgi:hypothetical protein